MMARGHGGRRRGAGRKASGLVGPGHRARERFSGRDAAQVGLRVAGPFNLRSRTVFDLMSRLLRAARERFGFRVVQFSLRRNRVLLVVEAPDWKALSRGAKGLAVRIARALNALTGRRGRVFPHRYEARILRRPFEARRALVGVLNRARKPARGWIDPFSSAQWFTGWSNALLPPPEARGEPPGIVAPRGWLLSRGWQMHGRIRVDELPRPFAGDGDGDGAP